MSDSTFSITVINGKNNRIVKAEKGRTLLDVLSTIHDFHIDASCGGKGTCGKCKVKVISGIDSEPLETEKKFLSEAEILNGYRLACLTKVSMDTILSIENTEKNAQIESAHKGFSGILDPVIKKRYLKLPIPSLEDQRDDVSRILETLGLEDISVPLQLKRKLPGILRLSEYAVTAVYSDDTLINVEPGNTVNENYGIAVDIGTTTVVAHLINLHSGEIVDTVSAINRQKTLGADVISRIEYCMREPEGLKILGDKILTQLGGLASLLVNRNGIDDRNVYAVMTAGNTTMIHLLSGIDPEGIASAPFIPGTLKAASYPARELGNFPIDLIFYTIPSISAYIGADITAGILATKMYERKELSLLIDIGTNGEIVLGNRNKLYCCSTAAGPAFEGAHITCGMGGISGAVDTLAIEKGTIKYSTIDNEPAAGICGSGIIDAVAVLLKSGIVDFTGRIISEDEAETDTAKAILKTHFDETDGSSFIIAKAGESESGENIVFTQKDIREVQLAKAAISAGVATLLHEADKNLEDIQHVFIAGGFGSYISKESAAAIGLIPKELLDRTESVGNTSGRGAAECLLSNPGFLQCGYITSLTEYIELSSNTFFQGKYMEDMIFPEP